MYEVTQYAEELKKRFSLTDFEALQIATKIQFNEHFEQAFLVSKNGKQVNALEAIGMALGYKAGVFSTIPDAILQAVEGV